MSKNENEISEVNMLLNWFSVDDKLPDKNDNYLVIVCADGIFKYRKIDHFNVQSMTWTEKLPEKHKIIYWMELPEMPLMCARK